MAVVDRVSERIWLKEKEKDWAGCKVGESRTDMETGIAADRRTTGQTDMGTRMRERERETIAPRDNSRRKHVSSNSLNERAPPPPPSLSFLPSSSSSASGPLGLFYPDKSRAE